MNYDANGQICEFFQQHDLKYYDRQVNNQVIYRCGINCKTTRLEAAMMATDNRMLVSVLIPTRIPEGARPMMLEAIARMNWGLSYGRFEMDLSDGELRFYNALMLADGEVPEISTIGKLFAYAIGTTERYCPAVNSIVYANESPEAAVRMVEAC